MEFFGSHRNATLTIPSLDILVRYRYTGHVNIGQTGMGLETFFHAGFQDELSCLLGAGVGCARRPDVLLVNSGRFLWHWWTSLVLRSSSWACVDVLGAPV